MKTTCKECGAKLDIDVPTDKDLLNRISALENQIPNKQEEDLATHLSTCPNCDKVIRDKVVDEVKKKWDLEDDEREEETEEEKEDEESEL